MRGLSGSVEDQVRSALISIELLNGQNTIVLNRNLG